MFLANLFLRLAWVCDRAFVEMLCEEMAWARDLTEDVEDLEVLALTADAREKALAKGRIH